MDYYFKGTKIYNPHTPRNYVKGGYVYKKPDMNQRQIRHDSVLAMLKPGEIVIPTSHKGKPIARTIAKYLKTHNIFLPHMKK